MRQALTTYAIRNRPVQRDTLQIQVGRTIQEVVISDILFIKGLGDYVIVQTAYTKFITHCTMNEMMDKLPAKLFARNHRSYIINISQVKKIEGGKLVLNENNPYFIIPVGRSHRKEIRQKLKQHSAV